jgi:hypothetical protein
MNANVKTFLLGLILGIAPIVICAIFYFGAPVLVDGNPGSLLSYAVMGLYAMSSLAVFITAIIFIVHNRPVIGATALFVQITQLVIAVFFLSGV